MSGNDSAGISLEKINFGHDVINEGTIAGSGSNTSGIVIKSLNFNALNNIGTIQVSGDNAVGIRVVDSLAPEVKTATNGIINTGNIISTGTGISVESVNYDPSEGGDDNANNLFVIHQNGGSIVGGEKSINGNFQTRLEWTAGTITGNMEGPEPRPGRRQWHLQWPRDRSILGRCELGHPLPGFYQYQLYW